jgi:hypothetical protein
MFYEVEAKRVVKLRIAIRCLEAWLNRGISQGYVLHAERQRDDIEQSRLALAKFLRGLSQAAT